VVHALGLVVGSFPPLLRLKFSNSKHYHLLKLAHVHNYHHRQKAFMYDYQSLPYKSFLKKLFALEPP